MTEFDFGSASLDDIDQYVMERMVWHDQQLSHILIGHLMIEGLLEALIATVLPHPERLFESRNLNFDLKLNIANALGTIRNEHFSAAKALNKLRNQYAHKRDFKISADDLAPFKFGWNATQRKAFDLAMKKSLGEAVQISLIFLSFSFQALLTERTD